MDKGWKRGGFTPSKQAKAVEALEKYGNATDAARVAGISDTTFYRHLKKNAGFARLCELARAKAARPLETLAWERAVEGTPEKTIRKGEIVQIKVKPSDAMLRLLLQASNPKKYGRLSRGGASRRQIERKLRKTIEAEVRAEMAKRDAEGAAATERLFDDMVARIAEMEGGDALAGRAEGGEQPPLPGF